MLSQKPIRAMILATALVAMPSACGQPKPTLSPPPTDAPASTQPEGQDALPTPVRATAERLNAAAMTANLPALILVAAETDGFRFSFGPDPDFATYLAQTVQSGGDPAGDLAKALAARHARDDLEGDVLYIWPAVAQADPAAYTPEDRAEAAALIGEEAATLLSDQNPYMGPRLAIDPAGRWIYFVKGD